MILNRYPLSQSSKIKGDNVVLVVNPAHADELYRLTAVPKQAQRLLLGKIITPFILSLPARCLIYEHKSAVKGGKVRVRLPQSEEEQVYMSKLAEAELWELSEQAFEKVAEVIDEKLLITGGSPVEKTALEEKWKEAGQPVSLISNLFSIAREVFAGLGYKKRTSGVFYPFPLFRAPFLSVFSGTRKDALAIILENLRRRYEVKRDIAIVKPGIVVTPNLDHIRVLFEENNAEFQEIYKHAFLQTPDGYPPLMMFGKASLGFQPKELITGVDIFVQLLNTIGKESLPYTIYIVGGFGNVPYKTRDYFTAIFPNMKENFVGISTPPMGFLNDEKIMDAITKDIEAKKPDIIFAGMTVPTQERFIYELLKRKVNFGLGFCIGRAIEMVAGYQKKEPALIERLHLSWIYRLFFGGKKEIMVRQRTRVLKDLQFVFKALLSR